jgi:hypothetical protein
MPYHEITQCRVCGGAELIPSIDMGHMAMTGEFPRHPGVRVEKGPVSLCLCANCSLLQMKQGYSLKDMYGDNYGYRSGLNASMVKHLQAKARELQALVGLDAESHVLDIGGNDGTLLKGYAVEGLYRKLVDPTAPKWAEYLKDTGIVVQPAFFGEVPDDQRYDIITSIACFYDMPSPVGFAKAVCRSLRPNGVWHFEQSYLPSMIMMRAYDTICHEHLEYYSMRVIQRILKDAGMRAIDVRLNQVNGGSFAVTAVRNGSNRTANHNVENVTDSEPDGSEAWENIMHAFGVDMGDHAERLVSLIRHLRSSGKTVAGLGASTKGNVILQYCGLGPRDIAFIADVNEHKHGCVTPGSHIPIVSEEYARSQQPDYMLVLPWHFREGIIQREAKYLRNGGKLIFPLPDIQVIDKTAL